MASALPRPRQVTIAGWMIMAGSAAVVVTVFQQIAGLHTIDTRDAVGRVLAQPPFDGMAVTVDDVLGVIRVLSMIAAACATATGILGWQALQRTRSARVALSILAVPLFVTGMGTGGILSTFVAIAILLLWVQPARDWFDGTWRPEQARSPQSAPKPPEQPRPPASARPEVEWPPPPGHQPPVGQAAAGAPQAGQSHPGHGEAGATQAGHSVAGHPQVAEPQVGQQPPPYSGWPPPAGWAPLQATWPPPTPAHAAPAPLRRPPAVMAAVIMTWVCSVLLGGFFVVAAGWLIASPGTLMDEMARQNPQLVQDGTLTLGLLRSVLVVMAGLVALWVLAACVLAFFVLRGAGWARVLLLLCSGTAALGLLLCTVVNVVMVVPLAGAVAVVALLLRREVNAWFNARDAQRRAG